jgi:hypothetical protein
MSIEAERIVHENPPTPEQLHTLASIGVKSAVSREKLRTLRNTKGVHYFVDELDHIVSTSESEELPMQIRHRMAVRIAARPPENRTDKIWSLKYYDTYFVESRNSPGNWLGERSTYRFEWTRSKVIMADRTLKLLGFSLVDDDSIERDLDNFSIPDDYAAILNANNEMKMVSSEDCDDIIKDMSKYFTSVESENNYLI